MFCCYTWENRYPPCATPYRPKGFSWPILPALPFWRAYSNVKLVMPVSINPGQIELMRMFVLCN